MSYSHMRKLDDASKTNIVVDENCDGSEEEDGGS